MQNKIAIICFKYPPQYSGYGKQLKSVITEMHKYDFEFEILTAYRDSIMEENEYIKITPLVKKNYLKQGVVFYLFCFKVLLWLVFNRKKYSVIHCIKAGPEAVVANFISKIYKKPLIVKVAQDEMSKREIENVSFIKKYKHILRNLLIKNSDNFIAISEDIQIELEKKVSRNTNIINIPNGVDTLEKFTIIEKKEKVAIRSLLNLPLESTIVLFAGAINRRKGVIDLLKSIEYIQTPLSVVFVFCGPILESINFEQSIKEINKHNKNILVKYIGVVNNVEEYMKASDIFVLPSYSEGLPNVLLEAAACGLALVTTDIGGCRDIVINGSTGLIVKTNHAEDLGKAITKLINDSVMRDILSKNARAHIEKKYSLTKVASQYSILYSRLLERE